MNKAFVTKAQSHHHRRLAELADPEDLCACMTSCVGLGGLLRLLDRKRVATSPRRLRDDVTRCLATLPQPVVVASSSSSCSATCPANLLPAVAPSLASAAPVSAGSSGSSIGRGDLGEAGGSGKGRVSGCGCKSWSRPPCACSRAGRSLEILGCTCLWSAVWGCGICCMTDKDEFSTSTSSTKTKYTPSHVLLPMSSTRPGLQRLEYTGPE
mmetsp:Transcript_20089/g.46811  ORF Transcript_20089/g.46811 Transcript_20089/m.46811 type:complete len:211 (+) Transcript_20089:59-691(+)